MVKENKFQYTIFSSILLSLEKVRFMLCEHNKEVLEILQQTVLWLWNQYFLQRTCVL